MNWWIRLSFYGFCKNTEELHKKDINDPDNHDGAVTHPEPDILEYEVKWASFNITDKGQLVLYHLMLLGMWALKPGSRCPRFITSCMILVQVI